MIRMPPGDYWMWTYQPWSPDSRREQVSFTRGEVLLGYEIELPAPSREARVALDRWSDNLLENNQSGDVLDVSDRCPESYNGPDDQDLDGCPEVTVTRAQRIVDARRIIY